MHGAEESLVVGTNLFGGIRVGGIRLCKREEGVQRNDLLTDARWDEVERLRMESLKAATRMQNREAFKKWEPVALWVVVFVLICLLWKFGA